MACDKYSNFIINGVSDTCPEAHVRVFNQWIISNVERVTGRIKVSHHVIMTPKLKANG
tara:strand:- start:1952 stop:2125 length:174 start_codon:yes stop_codon:yes gene_type:complete